MNPKANSVLQIDLEKKAYTAKAYPDLRSYLGGVGSASKLVLDGFDKDPVVFSIGPLNGYFPYASKTCAAYLTKQKFNDVYVGGRLSLRLSFSLFDSIVFENSSEEEVIVDIGNMGATFYPSGSDLKSIGTPGRKSVLAVEDSVCSVDSYFSFGGGLFEKLREKKIKGIVISSTDDQPLRNEAKFERTYREMLALSNKMRVPFGDFPSCSGCPLGCEHSKIGEVGGDVLVHSLVGCVFSEYIYGDTSNVFACLSALGYDYTHEELEGVRNNIHSVIGEIYEKLSDSQLEGK